MNSATTPPPVPKPDAAQGFVCPHCKNWHPGNTVFCPILGTPITKEQLATPTIAAEKPPAPAATATTSTPVSPSIPSTAATPVPASPAVPATASAFSTAASAASAQPVTPEITAPAKDSDRKAGFRVITVPRTITYHMPGMCVACGKPLNGSTAKIKTSHQQVSGNIRTTLSLDFPLCFDCEAIQKAYSRNSNKSIWISLGITLVLVILAVVSAVTSSASSGDIWLAVVCGGLLFWGIVYAIVNAIINRQLPKANRDQHSVITKSVSITGFSFSDVTFKFTNESFANIFGGLNSPNTNILANALADMLKKK